jgi:selenocysteine-specific elongation factor
VAAAAAGQRVALNLRDIDIAELNRGMALAAPDALEPSEWLTMSLRGVESAPALSNGLRLRAMLGTHEMDVRLRLLDRDVLHAGETGLAQIRCAETVALPAGEHVILRLPSPPRTIAGGKVLEPGARRERRNCPRILARLEDLRTLSPAALIAAEVEREAPAGTTLKRLSQLSALATPRIVQLIRTLPFVVTRSGRVLRKADVDHLLSRIPPPQTGKDRARIQNEADLALRIAEILRRGGLTPPSPGTIVSDPRSKRAVDRLLREGVIVRARDRAKEKEILFHRDAIEDAQRRLAPLLERQPGMLVTEVGAALGISRKYSMPLLDHLDTIRFTRRVNDRRTRA